MSQRPEIKRRSSQFFRLLAESLREKRVGESHLPLHPQGDELALTFIGHAGFLLELDNQRILIDPNFANWLILVRRLRRPGIAIGNVPPIDWILITHAHMDHLNRPSLRRILGQAREATGQAPGIILPRGNADIVRDLPFSQVIELERWQQHQLGNLTITHTPAQHWGARMLTDTHRGFGGYMIAGAGHSIYHAGDTAYFNGFHEIGRRLRPRIALLPIGAYSPEGFRTVHASPEDSLQAFLDLGAETLIPMHYGTFRLSHEPMEEPAPRLLAAARELGIEDKMCVLQEGITKFFPPEGKPAAQFSELMQAQFIEAV
jgi:L-ascorbate metabolism protein UlaG (beta-lactamase superfamily)